MATTIPQRELRNNPGQVLRRVEAGEELTVTVRGRPVADLIPTRQRPQGRRLSHEEFLARASGLLDSDDPLAAELKELDEASEQPFSD